MPIYKGKAFKQFLIDRYAMGFQASQITQEFESIMGVPVSESEIGTILRGSEPEIRKREAELLQELISQNVISTLISIKKELSEVAKLARENKDYRTFAQLANSSMKSLEVIISVTEKFKQGENTKKVTAIQNNYYAIEVLVKDGLIEVKNEKKLKRILGGDVE